MENLYIQKGEEKLLKLCGELEAVGMDWAEAKSLWDQLENLRKIVLAGAMPTEGSYNERERVALTSKNYHTHIMAMYEAQRDALAKEVKYKAVQAQIDALRTIISNKRAMLQRGIE